MQGEVVVALLEEVGVASLVDLEVQGDGVFPLVGVPVGVHRHLDGRVLAGRELDRGGTGVDLRRGVVGGGGHVCDDVLGVCVVYEE